MVTAAFVAPYLLEATQRFVLSAARIPEVRLAVITSSPAEDLPPELREALVGHWRVDDALDPAQLAWAGRGLSQQIGPVERLIGVLEQLQVPLAQVREGEGIEGMDVQTAVNVRDKARMKEVLRAAGIPCARHQLVHTRQDARRFVDEVGFPLVAKPPAGAGSIATYRLDDEHALRAWLETLPPDAAEPTLLEEWLSGEEHTLDSVTQGGTTVWSSISDYRPPPLEVLRTPWIQWTVLLPRQLDGPEYAEISRVGPAALQALGVRDALTHLEWFRRPDGSVAVSEVAARPPGAAIASMIAYSHDIDFYAAWGALMLLDRFEVPERRYASGTAYLRGMGHGRVVAVHGAEEVARDVEHLVVEARLPQPGDPGSGTYTGEGHVIVRHPETAVVEDALRRIVSGIRIELAGE